MAFELGRDSIRDGQRIAFQWEKVIPLLRLLHNLDSIGIYTVFHESREGGFITSIHKWYK